MSARFTFRKINSATSRLSSWVSKSNTLSKSGSKGNKGHPFKTRWLGKIALPKLQRNKRVLLVVLLLASSATALASLGVWRTVRPSSRLAPVNAASTVGGASKAYGPPATTNPPFTKLKEYVYAGGRLVTSEEMSCVPTLSPAGVSSPQGGGPGSFNFSMLSICSWTATSNVGWITLTGSTSGTGNGTVNYSVAANSGPQRVGTITVNGQAFNITQAPNPASCGYSLSQPSDTFPPEGGSRSLNLTADAGCEWNAVSSDASWLTASPADGDGDGAINYSVTANGGQQRIGSISITVGGQTVATLTVTQLPNQASCTFAFSPGSRSVGVGGENGVFFDVTTGGGCIWSAENNKGWITFTGGATNNTGNGRVTFDVHPNNGGSRTGSILVRGQAFTITQAQCDYVISPTLNGFGRLGGASSITVSTAASCPWSAVSNAGWITITGGSMGAGNGSVNYSVLEYPDLHAYRQGTITVAGQTFTIEQTGPQCEPACCCEFPVCICFPEQRTPPDSLVTDVGPRGLTARYFGNTTLSSQPALERINPAVCFTWASAPPDKLLPADGFSVRWSGQLAAPSSEAYTFYLYSAGGARLWVNNQLVIDRWQPPSELQTRSVPIELKAGEKADVRVEYYDAQGDALIRLLWSSASTPKQVIPRRHLYPEVAKGEAMPVDAKQQMGLLLPQGSDDGPKSTRPQPSAPSRWLASPLGRAGLVLLILIVCGALSLLLGTRWRRARRQFVTSAAAAVSRLRDRIAWLVAVMRLGQRKLARRSLGIVRIVVRWALSLWRSSDVARLKPILRRALIIALIVRLAAPLTPAEAAGIVRAAQTAWREARAYVGAIANRPVSMATVRRSGMVASAAAQAEQVDELQVCPRQLVMFVGERYTLTPVALDVNPGDGSKKVVHGVGMSWSIR